MSLFFDLEEEKKKEYDALNFRSKRRNLRQLKQKGKSNVAVDVKRHALLPGKRISKDGSTYWETRKNRSDYKGTNV